MANVLRAAYRGNLLTDPDGSKGPLVKLGRFAAGATTAIEPGTIFELTGSTNTVWVPLDSDFDMSAAAGSGGKVAVAVERVESGDRAGYYEIAVPRPGDLWEFDLNTASAIAIGTALYYHANSTATQTVLTTTAGTNIIGYAAGQEHYPRKQGHLVHDASLDAGPTIASTAKVLMCFEETNSYYSAFQRQ